MPLTSYQVNVVAAMLQSSPFVINREHSALIGQSTSDTNYVAGEYANLVGGSWGDLMTLADVRLSEATLSPTTHAALHSAITAIPALSNTAPPTYTSSYASEHLGFMRVLAKLANDELTHSGGSAAAFASQFAQCYSHVSMTNDIVNSMVSAKTYMAGFYSNGNDQISADILGVNRAALFFGQDIIKTGRVINLAKIARFGSPSVLLKTLSDNNALTPVLVAKLFNAGIESAVFDDIIAGYEADATGQRMIYDVFETITGDDLTDVTTPINFQHAVETLADLLNPYHLFPSSRASLTVPNYDVKTPNGGSKTYQLIFNGGNVNPLLYDRVFDLVDGIPLDLAVSCAAFSYAMRQITNIGNTDIEKFAQVVVNLEMMSGLDLVESNSNVAANIGLIDSALPSIATGSGKSGTLLMSDYFGAMSGIPYQIGPLVDKIRLVDTRRLHQLVQSVIVLLTAPPTGMDYNADTLVLIAAINAEFANITNKFANTVLDITTMWNEIGTQISREIAARQDVLTTSAPSRMDIYGFAYALPSYSSDTAPGMAAHTLEKIMNRDTIGGQSVLAVIRESRNAQRLGLAGITPYSEIPTLNQSGDLIDELKITEITQQTSINQKTVSINGQIITQVTGQPTVAGSLAGSSQVNLVPAELSAFDTNHLETTVETPDVSATDVQRCNCTC